MKITHFPSFGKKYAMVICVLIFSSFIFGQTTLAEFNFNSPSTWNVASVNNTQGALSLKMYNASGVEVTPSIVGGLVEFTSNNEGHYLELIINTTTYSNISVEWYGDVTNTLFGSGKFSLRHMGATPELIGSMTRNAFNGGAQSFTLSAAANNMPEIRLRITADEINQFLLNAKLRLDNLKITSGIPNITVFNNNTAIPNNSEANETHNTVFGNIQTNSAGEAKTYKIRNLLGNLNSILNVSDIIIEPSSGTTENDFVVESTNGITGLTRVTTPSSNPFGTLTIRFTPQAEGVRKALVKIYSNGQPNPYSFWVIGGGRSCNIINTAYVLNSMDPNIEQTLPSNLEVADFVGGTSNAHSPQIFSSTTTIYPNTNNLYTSSQASWFSKDNPKTKEFGSIDITKLRNVSIEFNVAAFANSNSTTTSGRRGVSRNDNILLSVFHNGIWYNVMELRGSNGTTNSTRRKYAFNPTGRVFEKNYNQSLTSVENTGENTAINGNAYAKFKLNIPLSISSQMSDFKFRITAKANSDAVWLIDDVQIKSDNAEFKTYTANGTWSPPGLPNANQKVIFEGNYTVPAAGLNICECEVMENGSVTIPSNRTMTVQGKIINHNPTGENFVVNNDANLIQIENAAINTGNIKVLRNSKAMVRQDATFWSSPVAGQNVRSFSPGTLLKRFYIYNEKTNSGVSSDYKTLFAVDPIYPMTNPIPSNWYEQGELLNTHFDPATYTFKKGWGYSIRVANNWTSTHPGGVYEGVFVGEPHNGDVTVPAYGKYTIIGNPYPSNISTHAFFDANLQVSNIHLWTHRFPVGNDYYDYGYLTVSKFGVAGLPEPEGPPTTFTFEGTIKVGQGFLVQNTLYENTQTEWLVNFNNEMRKTNGGVFYKNSNFENVEKHRFWISLEDHEGVKIAQNLLGYMEGATNDRDAQIDGERMGSAPLFSLAEDGMFTIQARAMPFKTSDVILLGFEAPYAGSYTIKLDHVDGLFAEGQDIYIKDKVMNITHKLNESEYQFESHVGNFYHRFEIVFKKKSNIAVSASAVYNSIRVEKINSNIEINSSLQKIKEVEIFNITGKSLYKSKDINTFTHKIPFYLFEKSIIIVNGVTETGEVFSKKLIMN